MRFARSDARISLRNDRIDAKDADRQTAAAAEILRRFDLQPGVILADEVGMGKTFVALATAVSVLLERGFGEPVVVMTPPALAEKWPKDFNVFREKCLDQSLRNVITCGTAKTGVEFLRLLDDDDAHRKHLIFLTHGALNSSINEGLIKLAVIKRAFKNRSSLSEQRAVFGRFAADLLLLGKIEARRKGLLGELLERPYADWRRVMLREDPQLASSITDDPVPRHFAEQLERMTSDELEPVVKGLHHLPLRDSENRAERLKSARHGIAQAMEAIWKISLRRAAFHSPLLILDEAHHAKNPSTRLASLFSSEESQGDSAEISAAGTLGGKFDRMLFLTATPFQLGHAELIRVVQHFSGVDWRSSAAPELTPEQFNSEITALSRALDDAQAAALRLDRAWSRLPSESVTSEEPSELDSWWEGVEATQAEGLIAEVRQQVGHARLLMVDAEQRLRPWVLRYIKDGDLSTAPGTPRRVTHDGAAISDPQSAGGLDIAPQVVLPFLLAGRAQSLVASTTRSRALFAEGLSSSFEAYLETRSQDAAPEEDPDVEDDVEGSRELEWYLTQLDKSLPKGRSDLRAEHPKVRATAQKAVALWLEGEKVLIFCHYRATGRALRKHVSLLLRAEIRRLAMARLPSLDERRVDSHLAKLGDRFFDDDQLRKTVGSWVRERATAYPALSQFEVDRIEEVVRRFVRTPSFLVRYLPLDGADLAESFVTAASATADGRTSLHETIDKFCKFLAEQCIPSERESYLAALDSVQVGAHSAKEVFAAFDSKEHGGDAEDSLLPNVRLANGEVRQETRMRLLLTFNTPLFPEILIASSVMAEGVDLHRNCRYVIHHDLCWNPSTLEQRSGRVDRIGCKAEWAKRPITLYMPYIAATQDEKMFRVVRDRERWFQIIMGENYRVDERSTDREVKRVPLPPSVQRSLTMRLHPSA